MANKISTQKVITEMVAILPTTARKMDGFCGWKSVKNQKENSLFFIRGAREGTFHGKIA